MQPTEIQVQRSLQALEAGGQSDPVEPYDGEAVPDGLVEFLADSSGMRLERMADARMRLASGTQPTADDLAERMVGRLVCDRLR